MTSYKTKLLHISSKDRSNQLDTTADFTVNLNNTDGLQNVKRVIVKQASIPNSEYNINQYNNKFVTESAGVFTIKEIEPGNYNLPQLTTALAAVGVTIELVEPDGIMPKLRIIGGTGRYLSEQDGNPMASVLGITQSTDDEVSELLAQGFPDLSGAKLYYIQSHALGEGNFASSRKKVDNIIAAVQANAQFGTYIHYSSEHSNLDMFSNISKRHGKNINEIDIKIVDHQGRAVNLNNLHLELILKIYY